MYKYRTIYGTIAGSISRYPGSELVVLFSDGRSVGQSITEQSEQRESAAAAGNKQLASKPVATTGIVVLYVLLRIHTRMYAHAGRNRTDSEQESVRPSVGTQSAFNLGGRNWPAVGL